MKYFHVGFNSDPKITGIKEGGFQAKILGENFLNRESYELLRSFFMQINFFEKRNFKPDFEVNLENVTLLKDALLTDFIHFTPFMWGCPFLISPKAFDLFSRFKIPEHYYYPAIVFKADNTRIDDFKLFYQPYLDYDCVDFSKTVFSSGYLDLTLTPKKNYQFKDYEEYKNYKTDERLRITKVGLADVVEKRFDILNLRLGGLFFSKDIKEKIIEGNLSGLSFRDNDIELVL